MCGWALTLFLSLQAASATVFVENATAAADLIALLNEELPPAAFVETATRADLRVILSADRHLTILDLAGNTLLDRPIQGAHDVAMRVAALLIIEARESWRPPPKNVEPQGSSKRMPVLGLRELPAKTATIASAWAFGGAIGAGFGSWRPPGAQLMLHASLLARYGALELGLVLSSTGRGCACALRTASLRVEPEATAIAAEARWWWGVLPAIEAGLWLAAGYQWESAEAQVIGGFAAPGQLERRRFDAWIARVGASLSTVLFEPLFLRADFGAHVQREVSVRLPPFEEYRGVPGGEVQRRAVGPWGALSIGLAL